MRRITFLIAISCIVLISSCVSYDVLKYSDIDSSEKTISMPPGGDRLVGQIKQYLIKKQWKITVYSGPEVTEKSSENETLRYDKFNTRYNCFINFTTVDFYLDGDYQYRYDITVVDNKTGQEVFTLSGLGKGKDIVAKFALLMENNYVE